MRTDSGEPSRSSQTRETLLLDRIRLALPSLSASHAAVGRWILASPEKAVHLSAAQLASEVDVSQPTVTRFCQAIGLANYQTLLLGLAEEVGRGHAHAHPVSVLDGIGPDDPLDQVVRTLTTVDIEAMELAARQLDHAALDAAARAVASARQTDVYGAGASALIAHELELRLFRIGANIRAWTEVHSAATSAALRSPDDVAIAISASGRTAETYEALAAARRQGATTIALTSDPSSPLAQLADLHLTAVGAETPFRTASFAARHAQLLVLDILYTRVAQLDYDRAVAAVAATSHIASDHRVQEHRSPAKGTP